MTQFAAARVPIIFFLLLLIGVIYLLSRSASFKGRMGERKVRRKIKSLIRKCPEYRSFHDITLKTLDGTTQIDHVLVSPFGIFVIETKNLKGWILGGLNQKKWTQTLYRKSYKFQNPLHQNFKHVKAVENFLAVDTRSIISIVVFVGDSEFRTVMPYNVVELHELLPFLQFHVKRILRDEEIARFSQKFRNPVEDIYDNKRDHIKNIKQYTKNPTCPRCGKPMVLRTARQGRNAGSKFWGCSGFPSCKATKNMA